MVNWKEQIDNWVWFVLAFICYVVGKKWGIPELGGLALVAVTWAKKG